MPQTSLQAQRQSLNNEQNGTLPVPIGEPSRGTPIATLPSEYEESQNDEVEVLRSIYSNEFEELETKSAWSKKLEKSFKLNLSISRNSVKDAGPLVAKLSLVVTLTATYPKTLPILALKDPQNVQQKTLDSLQHMLSNKPRGLLGEVMIFEIASEIERLIGDALDARALGQNIPSLEEERKAQELEATKKAQETEAEELKRQRDEKVEEDRMMQQMMEEEIRRRQTARRKRDASDSGTLQTPLTGRGDVSFDQTIMLSNEQRNEVLFREVSMIELLRDGPLTKVFEALPETTLDKNSGQNASRLLLPVLALKRIHISNCRAKKTILDFEDEVEKLKSLRNPSIINVYDFKIERYQDDWHFDILTDFSNRGSLLSLLELAGNLPVHRLRSCSIEVLEALEFYHKNGVVHKRLHLGNVLLCESSSRTTAFKLADAGFQDGLYAIASEAERTHSDAAHESYSTWKCPELSDASFSKTRKSDIWDFGVMLVQLVVGLDLCSKFGSPSLFMSGMQLTEPFQDLLRELFRNDPRKRPNAFDVIPSEFLRTDAPAVLNLEKLDTRVSTPGHRRPSTHRGSSMLESTSKGASRYVNEWDESARLGKGGYGEVVKARNKLDGRIYAIKKITQKTPAQLSEVLSEVYLLATLNHPYVVRYFTAWPEDDASQESSSDSSQFASTQDSKLTSESVEQSSFAFGHSTGGLDFISSSGYPRIEFGDDDDEESSDGADDEANSEAEEAKTDDNSNCFRKSEGPAKKPLPDGFTPVSSVPSRPTVLSTLYIQMEFCERLTMRDLIRRDMHENTDDNWRLFRQILEGLEHIHSHGIIHRDLKPENIFLDVANNPKIGDLGLATTGNFSKPSLDPAIVNNQDDMTRSVGTALYVAPELKSHISGSYTEKVDMYSLGIIFFEMCHPLRTSMERGQVLGAMRMENHALPNDFRSPDKYVQGRIIESLIRHKPGERPSSTDLLRSGKIPVKIEDEQLHLALRGLSDPNSPYYHRMMSALFTQNAKRQVVDRTWDVSPDVSRENGAKSFTLLQSLVKQKLTSVFRRHGALETARQQLIPRSEYYTAGNVAQLLDSSGTLVQLPYDLTLPHARSVAFGSSTVEKTFTFGSVFREASAGGAPRSNREADFDIVSHDAKDLSLKEAEVIKVMDEVLDELPAFNGVPMCFHVSHNDLLDTILDFCRVPQSSGSAAKEILGRLNVQQWTWQKIRFELRSPAVGISSTSLDELAQFDFRDTPERTSSRLHQIFKGTQHLVRLEGTLASINRLASYLKLSGLRRGFFVSPLSSFNDKFYRNGIMFQCLFDTKKKVVLAAGGRYDQLIQDHRPRAIGSSFESNLHGVGINIAWDRLVTAMARYQKNAGNAFLKKVEQPQMAGQWASRRCDVLVASFDSAALRSVGWKMVNDLWSKDISAELAIDSRSPEQLHAHYREDKHNWIIIIKHELFASGKPDLKIKSQDKKEESDVRSAELISYLRNEIRERDQREGAKERSKILHAAASSESSAAEKKGNVHVLVASYKSKKSSKWRIVESAHARVQELLDGLVDAPVASIETRDEVIDKISETRLSDPDSWRRVIQDVNLSDRNYLQEIHGLIQQFKIQYGETSRNCFIYNFRTGHCVYYDLNL